MLAGQLMWRSSFRTGRGRSIGHQRSVNGAVTARGSTHLAEDGGRGARPAHLHAAPARVRGRCGRGLARPHVRRARDGEAALSP